MTPLQMYMMPLVLMDLWAELYIWYYGPYIKWFETLG